MLVTLAGTVTAAPGALPLAEKFDPIPVSSIYRPLKPRGSADEALASGRVVAGTYPMADRASRPWRIAFLFPHIKDPYWIGCSYGVISEARRLGVAVDIFPADGYNDLVGQLRRMDEVIAAKYDAIVISPISLTANNISIAKARARGIPVFELANDSTSDDLTIKVTTSLKGMGRDATRWVIQDAQRRGLSSINIALLPGPAGAGWVKGEIDGTREAVREAPITVNIVDIRYGDSDRIEQSQLAAQLLAQHGGKLDYILGCTGCAPAARLPIQEAGLSGKIRVVAYDLTREIAGLIRNKEIFAAADTKGVSQARVATDAAVNFLEGRSKVLPHTILVKLGLVDQRTLATYKLDTSIAPEGYTPILSYDPREKR
ncbi:MAG: TMAO reductase system periplasmic protein TorT [Betaproteobacteria bacterium]|nr:TMAO reductase system periplasmic protein TorT [Betaproteobacteria bacterium]